MKSARYFNAWFEGQIQNSKTMDSLYWIVDTLKLFIYAWRTRDWKLHLAAVGTMLNLFAATGHSNYTKITWLYFQWIIQLPQKHPWLYKPFSEHGFHSVRRSDRYWAGLSTDLIIEQVMMRSIKSRSGLIRSPGFTETVRWCGCIACIAVPRCMMPWRLWQILLTEPVSNM